VTWGRRPRSALPHTDRIDGDDYNRVLGVDAHVVWRKIWFSEVPGRPARGLGHRAAAARASSGPSPSADRTGRAYGNHFELLGIQKDFQDTSGFVNRRTSSPAARFNRFSWYGRPGALVEQFSVIVGWPHLALPRLRPVESDHRGHPAELWIATLRGGWQGPGNAQPQPLRLDAADFSGYTVGTAPFVLPHDLYQLPGAHSS